MKATLRERCSKRDINVPALCSCHSTIWDADPMTCSQNCSFYRNPAGNEIILLQEIINHFIFLPVYLAFATSLHSLLTSCQATN